MIAIKTPNTPTNVLRITLMTTLLLSLALSLLPWALPWLLANVSVTTSVKLALRRYRASKYHTCLTNAAAMALSNNAGRPYFKERRA